MDEATTPKKCTCKQAEDITGDFQCCKECCCQACFYCLDSETCDINPENF